MKKIIDLLESLKLVAIWHYLVIALAVAAALFLIYIFQKKLFSREKLIERRISKGECQQCGKHLPAGSQACPFCGFAQFKSCSTCNKEMHAYGKFCRAVWEAVNRLRPLNNQSRISTANNGNNAEPGESRVKLAAPEKPWQYFGTSTIRWGD